MKRRLLIVAIFLLAGAVVNVAVAWGCAVWIQPFERDFAFRRPEDVQQEPDEHLKIWWVSNKPEGFAAEPYGTHTSRAFGVKRINMGCCEWDPPEFNMLCELVVRHQTGWPLASMEGAVWYSWTGLTVVDGMRDTSIGLGALPLRPMWVGTALDSSVYGAILWTGLLALRAIRGRLRVNRGLCPACAYPMGESDTCTECGKALPGRARVAT